MNIRSALENLGVPNVLAPFGKPITTKEEFEAAKPQIQELLQREEYGFIPEKPDSHKIEIVEKNDRFAAGKATLTTYKFTASVDGNEASFPFYSIIPKKPGKLPVFVHINFRDTVPDNYQPSEEIVDRGYAIFGVCYKDVTSDDGDFENGFAKVLCKDRNDPHAPGKIAIWAWSVMRIIDFVQTFDFYDENALAVIGHSRLGKTTLLTAAFDERVKFACVNNSGASGDALSRGKVGEDITAITDRFPFWFCPKYKSYAGKEAALPFDQHFLISLVAPRSVLSGTALEDTWADPNSQFLAMTLTDEVYKLYGIEGLVHGEDMPKAPFKLQDGNCSFHLREGLHYLSRYDWNAYMDFIDKKLGR